MQQDQSRNVRFKTITLTMPDSTWGRLATLADRKGLRIEDFVAGVVEGLVQDLRPPLQVLRDEVSEARKKGFRVPRRGSK